MSEVTFRPAKREAVGVIIGLVAPSGGGKTWSALELATGLAGNGTIALIDTENNRALHYADYFSYSHASLEPPFSPERYAALIAQADREGHAVIVVDSMSHEHAGDGGLLDIQEAELARMAGDDSQKRLRSSQAAWIKPKGMHKRFVYNTLLRTRAHLVLCLRAEDKTEMVKKDGRWEMVEKRTMTGVRGWVPICEKRLPFELTASLLLLPDKPGVPIPVKLQEQHRGMFPPDRAITREAGKLMAEWAAGGKPKPTSGSPAPPPAPPPPAAPAKPAPKARWEMVLDHFAAMSIPRDRLERKIRCRLEEATDAHLDELATIYKQIKAGAKRDELLPPKPPAQTWEQTEQHPAQKETTMVEPGFEQSEALTRGMLVALGAAKVLADVDEVALHVDRQAEKILPDHREAIKAKMAEMKQRFDMFPES